MNNETINIGISYPNTFARKDEQSSPILAALERSFDNLSALHVAIDQLDKRLVGVQLPSHGEGSEDGEDHPMPVQSPMLARIERQNRRITQAIDLIESITRRLEV